MRAVILASYGQDPSSSVLVLDAYRFQERAVEILEGRVLTGRPFEMVPLYPFILAVLYKFFGTGLLAVRLFQLACGIAAGLFLYLIGKRAFDRTTGGLAFLLYGLYGVFPYYEMQILATSLSVLCLLLFTFLFIVAMDKPAVWRWGAAGLAGGILVLIRPNFLPVMGCVCLYLLYFSNRTSRKKKAGFAIKQAAVFAAVFLIILSASLCFNFVSSGEWILLTAHSGINFYIGNNPEADGTYVAVRGIGGAPVDQTADAAKIAEDRLGRMLTAGEVSAYWSGLAMDFITSHPLSAFRLYVKKLVIFWNAYEVPSIANYNLSMRYLPRLCRGAVWFGLISPLSLLGMVILWRKRTPKQTFLYVLILSYIATLLLFYVNGRYRLPIVPFLILFTAAFLKWLYLQASDKRAITAAACLVTASILGVLVHLNLPRLHISRYEAGGLEKLGLVFISEGAYQQAEAVLDEAIRLDPENFRSYLNRGLALFFQGREAEGEASFQKAVALRDDCWEAWHGLGNIAMIQGRPEEAAEYYRAAWEKGGNNEEVLVSLLQVYKKMEKWAEAVDTLERLAAMNQDKIDYILELAGLYEQTGSPDRAVELLRHYEKTGPGKTVALWKMMARLYADSGKHAKAEALYLQVLEASPDDHDAHFKLGVLYHRQGDHPMALSHYREAADIRPENPLYHLNLGNIYATIGLFKEAEAAFMETLRLQPDMEVAKANLAEIRRQSGKP